MTSDEAVEAAAERDYGLGWADASEWERSAYLDHATNLIEAAAPHMLAEVWDAGIKAGIRCDGSHNPYRSQA